MSDGIEFPDDLEEFVLLAGFEISDSDLDFSLPSKIYHYTSTSGLRGILENNSLWFTHFEYLNDKSERYYAYQLFHGCLEDEKDDLKESYYQFISKGIYLDDDLNYSIDKTVISSNRNYYVCSFSTNDDSLNMWNYYTKTDNKTGYNIRFDTNKLINGLSNQSFYRYRVNYDVEKQKKVYKNYIHHYNNAWDDNKSNKYKKSLRALLFDLVDLRSLIFKHPAFINEEEFRIVFSIDDNNFETIKNDGLSKFRELNGLIVPYLSVSFDKISVDGIRISPTQKDLLAKKGLLMMLDNYGYKHISEANINNSDIPFRY